jgi:RNA polymerase sigma-70 factor (ECF subfamily)
MALHTTSPDVATVLAENHRCFLTFLARQVPTREIAKNILQEAFVRSLTKPPKPATTESDLAWFYRVLRNAIVERCRLGSLRCVRPAPIMAVTPARAVHGTSRRSRARRHRPRVRLCKKPAPSAS